MTFEDALRDNPAPSSVGDVALRYDAPVLIGEARGERGPIRLVPSLLFVCALGFGLAAVGLLIAEPSASVATPAVLGLLAGGCVAVGGRLERRVRHRRRFVLHFGDETVRVDLQGGLLRRPVSRTWHFDDVKALYVLEAAGPRFSLVMDAKVAPGAEKTVSVVLVDAVGGADIDALQRLWTALRAAFGLTRRPAAT